MPPTSRDLWTEQLPNSLSLHEAVLGGGGEEVFVRHLLMLSKASTSGTLVDWMHPPKSKDRSSTCTSPARIITIPKDESNLPSDVSACKALTAFEDICCCMDLAPDKKAITVSSVCSNSNAT